jgi:hypothetical protein
VKNVSNLYIKVISIWFEGSLTPTGSGTLNLGKQQPNVFCDRVRIRIRRIFIDLDPNDLNAMESRGPVTAKLTE